MQQALLEHISEHIKEVVMMMTGKREHGFTQGKMVLDQPDKMTGSMIKCRACIIHLGFSKVSTWFPPHSSTLIRTLWSRWVNS